MRVRMILALVAATSMALGVYTACGGDDSTTAQDAGGQDTGGPDTSIADTSVADVADTAPPCPDADLNALFNRDAAGVDAGAFGPCVSCLQSNCSSAVTTCNMDCKCKTDIIGLGTCIGSGMSPTTCGAGLLGDLSDPGVLAILTCVQSKCPICISAADGGSLDAGDGGG